MVTDDEITLARTLAKHPKWEWREAVRFLDARNPSYAHRLGPDHIYVSGQWKAPDGVYPDLADAATQGVMLQMCRDAGAGEEAGIEFAEGGWNLTSLEPGISHLVGYGWDTRGECLGHSWLRLQQRLGRIERGERWSDIG